MSQTAKTISVHVQNYSDLSARLPYVYFYTIFNPNAMLQSHNCFYLEYIFLNKNKQM